MPMQQRHSKFVISLSLTLVMILSAIGYGVFVRNEIEQIGTQGLLETYEQVNKSFWLFSERNWNVLQEWGRQLRLATNETELKRMLNYFASEKHTWEYSSLYLFDESDTVYWVMYDAAASGQEMQGTFDELYRTREPIVTSYRLPESRERKVAFAVPIEPVVLDGVSYNCLTVSYDDETLERLIGGHAYNDQSDCYLIHPNGDVLLSGDAKTQIKDVMYNLFDYLGENAIVDEQQLANAQTAVSRNGSGSLSFHLGGKSYYLVYQPVGFQSLSIVGVVEQSVVSTGIRSIQNATVLLLVVMVICADLLILLARHSRKEAKRAMERLQQQENAFRKQEEERLKMELLANTDGLTGLFNERYFNETLKQMERKNEPFSLFYLDLDRFKPVNDTFGHDVGNLLLCCVAERLRECVRSEDMVCRIGGDEFAILVAAELSPERCEEMCLRIKNSLCLPFELEGWQISISTSCGCAVYPRDALDVKEIRILADQRMYTDKANEE